MLLLVLLLLVAPSSSTPLLLLSSRCSLPIPATLLDAIIGTAYGGHKGSSPWPHDSTFCPPAEEPDVCCGLESWNARSCRDRLSERISNGKMKVTPLPRWHHGEGISVNIFAYHGKFIHGAQDMYTESLCVQSQALLEMC
jgi:hypothetical protein